MIEFKAVNKIYTLNGQQLYALKNINLQIEPGEIFGIVGESGAGKTSLIRAINLLDRPTSGQVLIDGVDILQLDAKSLRAHRKEVGMIFQHFNLLESRTAAENIALPLEFLRESKETIQARVADLLKWIKLEKHSHHYPRQLSGGQKQRVAIARALATQPKLLLCDEATSALDPQSTASILRLLRKINRELGVTIVLITHEMEVIKQLCDRALVIDQGEIVEIGNVLKLFAQPSSPKTEQLVQRALHLALPAVIQNQLQETPGEGKSRLVRFTFIGEDSAQPLLSTLIQQFQLSLNILQANIEVIQDKTVGFTLCTLAGDAAQIDKALKSIQSSSITAEVLGYV